MAAAPHKLSDCVTIATYGSLSGLERVRDRRLRLVSQGRMSARTLRKPHPYSPAGSLGSSDTNRAPIAKAERTIALSCAALVPAEPLPLELSPSESESGS